MNPRNNMSSSFIIIINHTRYSLECIIFIFLFFLNRMFSMFMVQCSLSIFQSTNVLFAFESEINSYSLNSHGDIISTTFIPYISYTGGTKQMFKNVIQCANLCWNDTCVEGNNDPNPSCFSLAFHFHSVNRKLAENK